MYAAILDDNGIDSFVNLTNANVEATLDVLQDKQNVRSASHYLNVMQMRSRLNCHRNSQLWVFKTDIADDVINQLVNDNHQSNDTILVELIKQKGIQI
jgi:hypothetical protein